MIALPSMRLLLKPVSVLATSGLTFLILLVATTKGQFADIAGYTAGASAAALVSAVVGSGTSLAFVTGDTSTQRAVRKVRYSVVAPALVLAAVVSSALYGLVTELNAASVLAGGVTVAFNNLAELATAVLERKFETSKMLVASVLSRITGLVCVAFGVWFSVSMLVVGCLGFMLHQAFARGYLPKVSADDQPSVKRAMRLAYAPTLMSVGVLDTLSIRMVMIVGPLLMSAEAAGALSTLVSAQQILTSLTVSTFYTLMAVRSEKGALEGWMRRADVMVVAAALMISTVGVLGGPLVIRMIGLGGFSPAQTWWTLLALAVLPYSLNRRRQFIALAEGRRTDAVRLLSVLCIGSAVGCMVAFALSAPVWLAGTSLIGEGGALLIILGWEFARRARSRRANPNPG